MDCSSAYEFAFRGLLTEEALDRAGRHTRDVSGVLDQDIADKLSLSLLDDDLVAAARRMATVYTAIAAFENSARELVQAQCSKQEVSNGGAASRLRSAIGQRPGRRTRRSIDSTPNEATRLSTTLRARIC